MLVRHSSALASRRSKNSSSLPKSFCREIITARYCLAIYYLSRIFMAVMLQTCDGYVTIVLPLRGEQPISSNSISFVLIINAFILQCLQPIGLNHIDARSREQDVCGCLSTTARAWALRASGR